MTDPYVLIVEDDQTITGVLADYLKSAGYGVSVLYSGINAVEKIQKERPLIVILDLMLPGKDGLTICREVRAFSDVPIIMVTAQIDDVDRLLGLELGADDYVCKPFLPKEVVARVRAILRRVGERRLDLPASQIAYRELALDLERFTCAVGDQPVELTRVEFRMLAALLEHPGRVYSRQQLMDVSYETHRVVSDRTIDTHVKNLRKKLHQTQQDTDFIHSIYGIGYKLE